MQSIEAPTNPKIKHLVKLAQNRHYRKLHQQAVIYGEHLLNEAIRHNLVQQVFVTQESQLKYAQMLSLTTARNYIINQQILKKINYLTSPVDIVAIIAIPTPCPINFIQDCVILENIQDVGNLGTILRSVAAVGIRQVLLSSNSVDIYNPKVLRASQGVQFGLNIIIEDDITSVLDKFNLQILAFTPRGNLSLYQCDLRKPTALVFGNEGNGLTDILLHKIPQHVYIPMHNGIESLNLAMATAISTFELMRQRLV